MAGEHAGAHRCYLGWSYSWDRRLLPALPPPPLHAVHLSWSQYLVIADYIVRLV